ncbi:helix-turn-helix domain-containing protein [Variovorax sp. J22R24]|uniref:GlxA family transcriptional regulator n=1 Tax=Variovorax gracilis TaxID=3053502 RepID=UPI002575B71E|nr:helix-turn-helix domain-containing protein [Variovorax sp. J22R24]MDM0109662.1 helix-turn-helix domain-containing protein [Variovorax sp. J22R24]
MGLNSAANRRRAPSLPQCSNQPFSVLFRTGISVIHFELMLPEGGAPGALWSAVDVLRELNALARTRNPRMGTPVLAWRLVDADGRAHRWHAQSCVNDEERLHARKPLPGPRILLLPPLEMRSIPALRRLVSRNAKVVEAIRERFDAGHLIGACGTSVWLLAQSGRLELAPVPWLYQSGFADQFPDVRIEAREPIVAQHGSVCAAAPPLLQALVLHLAAYAGLADLAHAGAEKLLLNAERQALSATMTSKEVMGQSRDTPLYRAQAWIQANAGRPLKLERAAAAASISERTLSRLFRQHLNKTPLEYLQELRLQRAQMWLEGTFRSVEEIAHDCGYTDTSAFCRMFARATGTSPRGHRERYTFRGPRAHWKLDETRDSESEVREAVRKLTPKA